MLLSLVLLALAPQANGAKLVMPTPGGTTIINYPSMQRCLAAKEALLQQARARADEDQRRTGAITISSPAVYCLPG